MYEVTCDLGDVFEIPGRPQTKQLEGTAYLAGAIIKLLVYCEAEDL